MALESIYVCMVFIPRWTQAEGKKFFMAPSLAVTEGKLNTQSVRWSSLLNYDLVGQIGKVTIGYETAQTLLLRKILVRCGGFTSHDVTCVRSGWEDSCVFHLQTVFRFTKNTGCGIHDVLRTIFSARICYATVLWFSSA